jgi:EAL domain-containing protein (putative c-di-GMP-specific phosphodiesterase class I)
MIGRLGRSVLVQACVEALRWQDMSAHPPAVNVNITPDQLQDPDIVLDVTAALGQTGLPASRLTLEITEGSIVQSSGSSLATLDRLVGLGVTIAIDDFGSGYSNLSYLRRLPVHVIKIDRAFTADLCPPRGEAPDDAGTEILAAIVSLAHAIGLVVVVEGVETMTQAAWLQSVGADSAQGWYFGRPADAQHIAPEIASAK